MSNIWYTAKTGVTIMASTPNEADLDFVLEASKRGLSLINVAPYNVQSEGFDTPALRAFISEKTTVVAGDDYLVLFDNGFWPVPAEIFTAIFTPILDAVKAGLEQEKDKAEGAD